MPAEWGLDRVGQTKFQNEWIESVTTKLTNHFDDDDNFRWTIVDRIAPSPSAYQLLFYLQNNNRFDNRQLLDV